MPCGTGPEHHRTRCAGILAGSGPGDLRSVIGKSIAVSSGKGGVGKTITACNLAIYYARKGMRVGLVDLDPLSDVASLLDLYESEQALQDAEARRPRRDRGSTDTSCPSFEGLEILFPFQKLDPDKATGVDGEDLSRSACARSTRATTC